MIAFSSTEANSSHPKGLRQRNKCRNYQKDEGGENAEHFFHYI
jgi:hypothetical protein